MKLYFVPFACSLATRIAIVEAELDAEFIQVMPDAILPDGRPFTAISPMGCPVWPQSVTPSTAICAPPARVASTLAGIVLLLPMNSDANRLTGSL